MNCHVFVLSLPGVGQSTADLSILNFGGVQRPGGSIDKFSCHVKARTHIQRTGVFLFTGLCNINAVPNRDLAVAVRAVNREPLTFLII